MGCKRDLKIDVSRFVVVFAFAVDVVVFVVVDFVVVVVDAGDELTQPVL